MVKENRSMFNVRSRIKGPVAKAGTPFSLWVGPAVKPEDLARYRVFGEDLVKKFTAKKK
jgi:hypothetical protein